MAQRINDLKAQAADNPPTEAPRIDINTIRSRFINGMSKQKQRTSAPTSTSPPHPFTSTSSPQPTTPSPPRVPYKYNLFPTPFSIHPPSGLNPATYDPDKWWLGDPDAPADFARTEPMYHAEEHDYSSVNGGLTPELEDSQTDRESEGEDPEAYYEAMPRMSRREEFERGFEGGWRRGKAREWANSVDIDSDSRSIGQDSEEGSVDGWGMPVGEDASAPNGADSPEYGDSSSAPTFTETSQRRDSASEEPAGKGERKLFVDTDIEGTDTSDDSLSDTASTPTSPLLSPTAISLAIARSFANELPKSDFFRIGVVGGLAKPVADKPKALSIADEDEDERDSGDEREVLGAEGAGEDLGQFLKRAILTTGALLEEGGRALAFSGAWTKDDENGRYYSCRTDDFSEKELEAVAEELCENEAAAVGTGMDADIEEEIDSTLATPEVMSTSSPLNNDDIDPTLGTEAAAANMRMVADSEGETEFDATIPEANLTPSLHKHEIDSILNAASISADIDEESESDPATPEATSKPSLLNEDSDSMLETEAVTPPRIPTSSSSLSHISLSLSSEQHRRPSFLPRRISNTVQTRVSSPSTRSYLPRRVSRPQPKAPGKWISAENMEGI